MRSIYDEVMLDRTSLPSPYWSIFSEECDGLKLCFRGLTTRTFTRCAALKASD